MNQFDDTSFDAPIPGMGMTHELGARPWQTPPTYTTVEETSDYYIERMSNPKFKEQLLDVMEMKIPLTTLANTIQLGSVMEGLHTVDVGMLMIPILVETMALIGDTEYYKGIGEVKYEGKDSKNPFAFKYYDPNKIVAGKTLKDHFRFAIAYWHSFCGQGTDPFGLGTQNFLWDKSQDPFQAAKDKADAAFEFITKMGFDLVSFSGGKGIRGPQSAGLLLGKRKYIEAARMHTPPRGETIGRGMKVNKEEVLGMLVALELYLQKDHKVEWAMWEAQIKLINDSALEIKGVETEVHVPKYANHVPSLRIRWDQSLVKITPSDVRDQLKNGHPSIQTVGDNSTVGITTWMMLPGQERIVAKRVSEILFSAT